MMPDKPKLFIREIILAIDTVAAALMITPIEARNLFSDARITGRLAEIWGARLYNYQQHRSSNYPGSDGAIPIGQIGRYDISVKTFKNRCLFQQSKYIGSGRSCTKKDLVSSIECAEVFVVADIRGFPIVMFYPLDSKWLLRLVHSGILTPSGLKAAQFDALIEATFDVVIER